MIVTRGLGRGGLGTLVALGLAVTGATPPILQPWDLHTRLIVNYSNVKLGYPGVADVSVLSGVVLVNYSEGVMNLLPSDGHKLVAEVRPRLCGDGALSLSGPGQALLILV